MSPTGFGSTTILKLFVILCLISIAEHGDEAVTSSSPTGSRIKSISGASLVQKRSQVKKQTQELIDEDDEDDEDGNAMHVQLSPDGRNNTKRTDRILTVNKGPASQIAKQASRAKDEIRSSNDKTAPLNVAEKGDDGLTISMVGNLSNANASGAPDHTNSSARATSIKWPVWLLVAQDRCLKIVHDVASRVVLILVTQRWVSGSTGSDEGGSTLLVCFGMVITIVLFAAFSCVHQLASRQIVSEELEDSSVRWFRRFDDSSSFSSPNRHPWYFRWLGFSWSSRFSAKPMPPYSVKHAHFDSGA